MFSYYVQINVVQKPGATTESYNCDMLMELTWYIDSKQFISKQQYQYFPFSSGNCIWPMEEKLEEHQIVHTGEKPLLGNLCDKIFLKKCSYKASEYTLEQSHFLVIIVTIIFTNNVFLKSIREYTLGRSHFTLIIGIKYILKELIFKSSNNTHWGEDHSL